MISLSRLFRFVLKRHHRLINVKFKFCVKHRPHWSGEPRLCQENRAEQSRFRYSTMFHILIKKVPVGVQAGRDHQLSLSEIEPYVLWHVRGAFSGGLGGDSPWRCPGWVPVEVAWPVEPANAASLCRKTVVRLSSEPSGLQPSGPERDVLTGATQHVKLHNQIKNTAFNVHIKFKKKGVFL